MGLLGWVKRRWGDSNARVSADTRVHDPSFEQLEPRLLLSADALIPMDFSPFQDHPDQAIVVDLDHGSGVRDQGSGVRDQEAVGRSDSQTVEQVSGEDESGLAETTEDNDAVSLSDSQTVGQSYGLPVSQLGLASELSQTPHNESLPFSAEASEATQSTTDNRQPFTNATVGRMEIRGSPTEIVFIDEALNQDLQCESAVRPGVLVKVLPAKAKGIQYMTDILAAFKDLSAIHIVSHGASGSLALGSDVLSTESLARDADMLFSWGASLSPEADILLYGCSVSQGEVGIELIHDLAELTGADVAASDDPTGVTRLGGDWDLEVRTGVIQAEIPVNMMGLDGVLALDGSGDIAFTGFNADGHDDFAVVTLDDIDPHSSVYFNENEWDGSSFNTGEGAFGWDSGASAITAGTIITFSGINARPTPSVGALTGERTGSINLNASNEGLWAYLGSDIGTPTMFLAAIFNDEVANSGNSLANTGLTSGSTAISIAGDNDVMAYNGTRSGEATFDSYLPLIGNSAHWSTQDGSGDQSNDSTAPDVPFDTTAFILTTPTTVSLSGHDLIIADMNGTIDNQFVLSSDGSVMTIQDLSGNAIDSGGLGTGDGTDTVMIDFSTAGWTGGIIVNAAVGDNSLEIDTALNLNGPLAVMAETITLNGSVDTGMGSQTYSGPVLLGADVTLTGHDITFNGSIDGAFNLSLEPSGTATFAAAAVSTYTGVTSLASGTTLVDGTLDNNGGIVTVQTGATLGGTGAVDRPIEVQGGATLAPGLSPEILHTGSLRFNPGSGFTVKLNEPYSSAGTDYDQLNVTGTVSLGNADLNLTGGTGPPVAGTVVTLINNDSSDAVTGTFNGLAEGATVAVNDFSGLVSYVGGDGNDVVLTMDAPPSAEAGGPYTVPKGGRVVLDGTGSSDAGQPANTLSYAWDLDGDGVFGETGVNAKRGGEIGSTPTFSALGLNGPLSVIVTLRVTDSGNLTDEDSATINVAHVAPAIDSLSATSVNEHGTVHLTGTYHPTDMLDTPKLTIDWGEGSLETVAVSGGSFDCTHRYLDDNPTATPSDVYTINVTLTDHATGTDASTTTTVTNLAPTLRLDSVIPIDENGIATLTGVITDAGALDTFTLDVDWGDPLSPDNVEQYTYGTSAAGTQTFALTHQYLDDNPPGPGSDTYVISATVADDDTGLDSDTMAVQVNNVAPTANLDNDGPVLLGTTAAVTFSNQVDVSSLDRAAGFHYAYDFDSDGNFEVGDGTYTGSVTNRAETVPVAYLDSPGVHTIAARILDDDGGYTDTMTQVTVIAETMVTLTSGNVTVTDVNGAVSDDTLTLSIRGNRLHITDPNLSVGAGPGTIQFDSHTVEVARADMMGGTIRVDTLGGDDSLTIDFSGGDFVAPIMRISFQAGGQNIGRTGDSLTLRGGTFHDADFTFDNSRAGSIDVTGNATIVYTGLEPISSTIRARNVTLNYSPASETIRVIDSDGGRTTVASTAGETTTFAHPSDSLTLNAGSGDDTIDISSLASGYPAYLTINGQGDTDTISFAGNISLAPDRHLSATGETIQVNSDLSTTGSGTVTLDAGRRIDMNSGSSISTVDGGITLDANGAGTTTGGFIGIDVDGASLTATGTGSISISGQGGDTSSDDGVTIDRSTFRVAGGNMQILGNAGHGIGSSDGVDIGTGSVIESAGSGSIFITGTAGSGSSSDGVEISDASVVSVAGTISISGDASDAGNSADGVEVDDSHIESISGTIQINGDSRFAGSSADGLDINDSSFQSATGDIQLTGIATGAGSSADGVELAGGSLIRTTDTGTITINGQGQADGVYVTGTSTEVASVYGAITVDGLGGGQSSSEGVHISGNQAKISSIEGDILITGNSGGDDDGVEIDNGAQLLSTGTGPWAGTITVNGTGGSGTTDYGVELADAGTVMTAVDGNIRIVGTGPGGDGVYIGSGAVVSSSGAGSDAGQVSIEGTGGGLSGDEGVHITGNDTLVTSIDGDIRITGDSGGDDDGVEIDNGAQVSSTGTGLQAADVTIVGMGGSGSADYGVEISSTETRVCAVAGHIAMTGTGAVDEGIYIGTGAAVLTTGSNGITLTASDLALTGTINGGSGPVTLLPSNPGLSFDLGSTRGSGRFVVTDAEFDRIFTSNRIRIGDPGTGTITFTDTVDPAGADTLELIGGATLADTNRSGYDFIGLQLILDATLAPGRSPGVFRVDGSVVLKQGHAFQVEIGGTSPGADDSDHDQLLVTGTVTLDGAVDLDLQAFDGFVPGLGDTFVVIDNQGSDAVMGVFDGLAEGTIIKDFLGSGLTAVFSCQGGDGNDVVITVPEVSLSVPLTGVLEDSGQTLDFIFSRSGDTAVPLTVIFGVAGSADFALDYTARGVDICSGTAGQVSFLSGVDEATVSVKAVQDTMVEADETVRITAGAGPDYNVGAAHEAIGTIINDDTAELRIADVSGIEGDALVFTVTISNAVQGGVKVDFQTVDRSAQVSDGDYVSTGGTVKFSGPAGEQQTLTVTTTADNTVEADETFIVSLKDVQTLAMGVSAASIDITDTALGVIGNDDTAVLMIADVAQLEDDGRMTFTVRLSRTVQDGLTVDYLTSDLTATLADNDYDPTTGTLTFRGTAGETQTFTVDITDDGQVEFDEDFTVSLSHVQPLGAGVDPASIDIKDTALGTILRDDGHDITDLVSMDEVQVIYDHQGGRKTVDVIIINRGGKTLYGPLQLIVEIDKINQSIVSLGNSDGLTFDGKSYVDMTDLTADGQMDPGELVRVRLVFDGGARCFFDDSLSLRGMLADQAPPVDTEAPQVSVDLLATYDPTPALTGTVDDPQAIVNIQVEGHWYRAFNHEDGTWRTLDVLHLALSPGRYDVLVRATDPAGNTSQGTFPVGLTILTPEPPIVEVDDPPAMTVQSMPEAPQPVTQVPTVILSLPAPDVTVQKPVTSGDNSASDPEPELLDDQVEINVLQQQNDHQSGDVTVGVLLTNRSGQTIQGPRQLTVAQVSTPVISLAQPSGQTSSGLDYLDLTGYLDDLRFESGRSLFVSATFNNAARCHFEFQLGICGFPDRDDDWVTYYSSINVTWCY